MITLKRNSSKNRLLAAAVMLIFVASCGGGLLQTLQNSNSNLTPNQSESETPYASFSSYPAPVLGVVIDEFGKVINVEPGSAAEEAGITRDDILETVNGVSVNLERENVRRMVRETSSDRFLRVKLNRKGSEIEISVKPTPPTPRTDKAIPTPVSPPFDYL
jgi:S1-C subfamily serine protease